MIDDWKVMAPGVLKRVNGPSTLRLIFRGVCGFRFEEKDEGRMSMKRWARWIGLVIGDLKVAGACQNCIAVDRCQPCLMQV